MPHLRFHLHDEAGTAALGASLARALAPGLTLFLHGDLGTGKTMLTRALLHAAGEHLYGSLGVSFEISGPEDISASFLNAARRLSARPQLAHALVQTTAGRSVRSTVRGQRVDAVRAALKPLTDRLDAETARWAGAVITHLCSAASWVIISGESDIDEADAQRAVAWAIDSLISTLEKGTGASAPRSSRSSSARPRK